MFVLIKTVLIKKRSKKDNKFFSQNYIFSFHNFSMIIIEFLWTSFCFFYGTFLFIKNFFNKNTTKLSVQSIKGKWYSVLLGFLSFFYIPLIAQKICFGLLPHNLPKVDKLLWLAFGGELSLLCLLIIFLYQHKSLWATIQTSSGQIKQLFKQIFDGFCQYLPLLFIATSIWQILLNLLIQMGVPITLSSQPIIELLGEEHPHFSSLIALGVCVIVFAPLCEEIFFRGFGIKLLVNFLSPHKALWISSLIFAIAHQHFPTLLPLMVLGYWLGLIYIKTNNIWINVGIHSLFNGTNLALILLFK